LGGMRGCQRIGALGGLVESPSAEEGADGAESVPISCCLNLIVLTLSTLLPQLPPPIAHRSNLSLLLRSSAWQPCCRTCRVLSAVLLLPLLLLLLTDSVLHDGAASLEPISAPPPPVPAAPPRSTRTISLASPPPFVRRQSTRLAAKDSGKYVNMTDKAILQRALKLRLSAGLLLWAPEARPAPWHPLQDQAADWVV
jgi:hypothetical protein